MRVDWWLDTRDKPGLLWAFLRHFSGGTLSLEGHLGALGLGTLPGAGFDETGVLVRHTAYPYLDFVTLPVTDDTIRHLQRMLSRRGLFADGGDLVHVQLAFAGTLVLGAYDNFHKDCVVANAPTPLSLLQRLKACGTLRDFMPAAEGPPSHWSTRTSSSVERADLPPSGTRDSP